MTHLSMAYLEPSQHAAISLLKRAQDKPFVMLNLIRLKKTADYSNTCLSSSEYGSDSDKAFDRYIEQTRPFLEASGGSVLLNTSAQDYFVGPESETWDRVMLIQQNSVSDFFAFAQNEDYLDVLAHREASVEDSRLLPLFCDKG